MKRDMDLVREILIEMEKWTARQKGDGIKISGHSDDEITYHLGLMHDAGLIQAANASSHDGEAWIPVRILWEGHEFLDAARSDTVWAAAKAHVLNTTGTLTVEALKVALAYVMHKLASGAGL